MPNCNEQNINIGIFTNHNKFSKDELVNFKKSPNEEILLFSGVELSVNDGANGIHIPIVYSNQWQKKGDDYISPFISSMFIGKAKNVNIMEGGEDIFNEHKEIHPI